MMSHYGGLYVVCIWTQTKAAEPAPVVTAAAKVAEDEEKEADRPEEEAATPADPVAEDEVC